MKKLYKIKTYNTMVEEFEVVVEDQKEAKDFAESLVFNCYTNKDDYPLNVVRTSQYFDDKRIVSSEIIGYECDMNHEDVMQTAHPFWFRFVTSEEILKEYPIEQKNTGKDHP